MTAPLSPWWGQNPLPKLKYAAKNLERAGSLEISIIEGKKPLDAALSAYLKSRGGQLGSNDRAVLSQAVYGFARNRLLLLEAAKGVSAGEGRLLLLALLDGLAEPPLEDFPLEAPLLAIVQELRLGALKKLENTWNRETAELDGETLEAFSLLFSLPPFWLLRGPWKTLGEAAAELSVGKRSQLPQLRVNASFPRETVLGKIRETIAEARETALSPWGIVLPERVGAGGLKGLPVEFQDEGSQLAALFAAPVEAGARVLDLCAGSGGKALALANLGNLKIFLFDAVAARLKKAVPRLAGSGGDNFTIIAEPEKEAPFDLVFVDAPCSSSGTLRRNPDIAWRWNEEALDKFPALQLSILERAAGLVKPGGTIVYVTCSLFDAENFGTAERFLSQNPFFTGVSAAVPPFSTLKPADSGALRLPLNLQGYAGDGFFLAKFKKLQS